MKDTKTSQPKPVEVPPAKKREDDSYLSGYVDGVYDCACVVSLIAVAMVGVYWLGVTKR